MKLKIDRHDVFIILVIIVIAGIVWQIFWGLHRRNFPTVEQHKYIELLGKEISENQELKILFEKQGGGLEILQFSYSEGRMKFFLYSRNKIENKVQIIACLEEIKNSIQEKNTTYTTAYFGTISSEESGKNIYAIEDF